MLLLGGIKDLKKVWGLLKRYNGATGMLANAKKTEGLALGRMKGVSLPDTPIIKKPMGKGPGDILSPKKPEWIYPTQNSPNEIILKEVCEYAKIFN